MKARILKPIFFNYKQIGVSVLVICNLFLGNTPSYSQINLTKNDLKENSKDSGKLFLTAEPVTEEKYIVVKEQYEEAFQDVVNGVNETARFKSDIKIILDECGTDEKGNPKTNAFYDNKEKKIVICYELLEYNSLQTMMLIEPEQSSINKLFNKSKTPLSMDAKVLFFNYMSRFGAVFILYHELGHALIDLYNLPVFAAEESVADSFALMAILETNKMPEYQAKIIEGFKDVGITLNGSEVTMLSMLPITFEYYAKGFDKRMNETDFANEHPLDKQRFYNIICFWYGSNPQKFPGLSEQLGQRASRCPSEYQKGVESWENVFKPYSSQEAPTPNKPSDRLPVSDSRCDNPNDPTDPDCI